MYECDIFIVASSFLCLVLRIFLRTLVGVTSSTTLGGNTKYTLMGFTVLLLLKFPQTLERCLNQTSKGMSTRLTRSPVLLHSE